jgi:hypothetical protein
METAGKKSKFHSELARKRKMSRKEKRTDMKKQLYLKSTEQISFRVKRRIHTKNMLPEL